MSNDHARRRFLQLAGTGTVATMAGCAALDSSDDDGSGEATTVAATLSPDEEAAQELQQEAFAGEIDEEEFDERAEELLTEASDAIEEADDLTVEESELEFGLAKVSGSADAILEALSDGIVGALYAGDDYEEIIEQQRAQQEQQVPGEGQLPDEEGDEEGEGDDAEEPDDETADEE